MTYDYPQQSYLSKTILAGVFAGIIATLANLAYDYFFRNITWFAPSQIINVATIIFTTMLFFTVSGLLYFFASKFLKKGAVIYMVIFAMLTFLCCSWAMQVNRSIDPRVTADFRILLLGIVSITGILSTFFIPYLMKHQSLFLDCEV